MGNCAYADYREYLAHPLFRVVRAVAMRRTAWRCERCGSPATEVHHPNHVYPPWGSFDVPANLQPVCHPCHCALEGKSK